MLGTQTVRAVWIAYRDIGGVISRRQLLWTGASDALHMHAAFRLQFGAETDPPRPHVENWTSLESKADPHLTSIVVLEAPPLRFQKYRREAAASSTYASVTGRTFDNTFTPTTRAAAREPRKGCIAYRPRRLLSYSSFTNLRP